MDNCTLPSESDLRALLGHCRRNTGVPGIAVAVNVGDGVVAASSGALAGGTDSLLPINARFTIGCLTKLITSLLSHQLLIQGRLSLEASVGDFLPKLAATPRGAHQRLRDLLGFRSGHEDLPDELLGENRAEHFAKAPQLFRPGSVVSYESSGYAILGDVIEQITSTPYGNLAQEHILQPLGIFCDGLRDDCADSPKVPDHQWCADRKEHQPIATPRFRPNAAFSDLTMSVEQLLSLARVLSSRVTTGTAGLLKNWVASAPLLEMDIGCLPIPIKGTIWKGIPLAFGMGYAHYGNGLYGFDGGSFGQVCGIRCDPVRGVCIAIGINANTPSARNSVMEEVLNYVGIPIYEWPITLRQSYDFDLQHLVGAYRGTNGTRLEVSLEGSSMVFAFRGEESPSKGVRIPVHYEPASNTLVSAGSQSQRRVNLAAFLSPDDFQPCVACEVTAFRKSHLP